LKQKKFINVEEFEQEEYPVTFIIGARGVGKTISSLSQKLKSNWKNHTMFIYLRRYQSEIETASFNLSLLSKLVGHTVTRDWATDKNGKKVDCLLVDNTVVCYLLALSTAAKYKSNDYSEVTEIIYDEFIDPRGRELKNETKLFLNFAMTVFRDFSKYHALFLANATNLYNCYFLDFMVMPKYKITKFSKLGIKIVMYQTSDALNQEHYNSVLGQQVLRLEGEDSSSLANRFDNAFDDFISGLTKYAKYQLTVRLDGVDYGVYSDVDWIIISTKVDPSYPEKYAMTYDDATNDFTMIDPIQTNSFIVAFKRGQLRFTDVKSRSKWIKFFKHPYVTGGDL
jgi:hypothetical protein